MPRIAGFLVFLGIMLGIIAGIHVYLWIRLVRDTALPPPWRAIATWGLVIMAIGTPATMFLGRAVAPQHARLFVYPGYIWLGLMFLLFMLLVGVDVVRVVAVIAMKVGRVGPVDPERRLLLARAIGGAVAAVGGGLAVFGVGEALGRPKINTIHVNLPKLPPALDGFTIAQLTDIHIGPTLGRAFLDRLVARTNELHVDAVCITGDLVDGSVAQLRDDVAALANLKAKRGVYFVTGNHEYYSGAEAWCAHLPSLGIRVLRNERVSIGEGDATFDLAGTDDLHAHQDLDGALAGRDESRALVLMAHQPKTILESSRRGVGLQISGHTHGGQIWPFRYMVFLQQPYIEGLHKHGDAHLYVSRGCGYWGPPMRVHAPPEIAKIVLHPA